MDSNGNKFKTIPQDYQQAPFDFSHLRGPKDPSTYPSAPQQLKDPSVRQNTQDLGLDTDESIYHDTDDDSSRDGESIYFEEDGSPVKTFGQLAKSDLYSLTTLENLSIQSCTNVAAGGPQLARVSDIHVPKDLTVVGGAEKKKRAPPGTNSSTKSPDPDFRY